ncbi:MAG: thioredoxin domain-containing protein [Chloroflexota bacterium]|nr:thioredoxin domain-containing protein [Chloroflexota bacterium]
MFRLIRTIAIVALMLSQLWIIRAQPNADPYADLQKSRTDDGAFVLGNPEAPVKIIEFSDFLCASCQNYEPVISSFIREFVVSGQARFEYRIFPIVDPELSVVSASLVECADTLQPGQFWRAHDLMFQMTSSVGFTAESYTEFAEALALDSEALLDCASEADQHRIDADYGMSLGVNGTPSLFVQYGDSEPLAIALALPEHYAALVSAIRPQTSDPVTIRYGDYAGLATFRRDDGAFVLGDPDAPLTIVAFEDFFCPHCQVYAETVRQFIDAYVRKGQANFEFRLYPLINPQYSTTAAKVAECVAVQDLGQFWDAHDLLFQFAATNNAADMADDIARLLALDAAVLSDCLDRAMQFLVDVHAGQRAGVSGTPAIRARDSEGALQFINIGDQPQARGGLPIDVLAALAEGAPGVTIGAPERSLLNEGFLQDTSLMSETPCAPPCWQNITPGQTSLAEAEARVAAIDSLEIAQSGGGAFAFRHVDGPLCCQISSQDGETVSTMLLQFAPSTNLGQVFAARGEPTYAFGQPFNDAEAIVMLYYPEQNMLLSALAPGVDGSLSEASPVVAAVYATSDVFAAAFGSAPLQAWGGYLSYRDYAESGAG